MISRRAACRALAVGAATLASRPAGALRQATYFRWQRLADGAWVASGGGGNSLLIQSAGAAALVDCKLDGLGETLRREAADLASSLRLVVNTHHHRDHTGGTVAFRALPVHAQQRCIGRRIREAASVKEAFAEGVPDTLRARLVSGAASAPGARALEADLEALGDRMRGLDPQSFAPREGFTTAVELGVGSLRLELRHEGRAHTDNDAWVRIPERNLIHSGDLLFVGTHPVIDVDAGATTPGWQETLRVIQAAADDATVVVPGHGPVTDRAGLERQWEYFERARAAVAAAIAEGRSRDEIVAMRPAVFDGIPEARAGRTLGILYDEII